MWGGVEVDGEPGVARAVRHVGGSSDRWRYIAAACRVGNHVICNIRPVAPCTCPCHSDIYSLVWREGDYVIVTYSSGQIELRSGRLIWTEELAEAVGLGSVAGAVLARREWIREPPVFLDAGMATASRPDAPLTRAYGTVGVRPAGQPAQVPGSAGVPGV